jgi:hypothetical protein
LFFDFYSKRIHFISLLEEVTQMYFGIENEMEEIWSVRAKKKSSEHWQ